MNKLNTLVEKAKHSQFYLWLLNYFLLRTVPFNKSHKIKVESIREDELTICAPTNATIKTILKAYMPVCWQHFANMLRV